MSFIRASASSLFPRTCWLSACCLSSHAHSVDSQSAQILSPMRTCTNCARFKVLTSKLTPCRLGYKHRCFRGPHCPYLQGRPRKVTTNPKMSAAVSPDTSAAVYQSPRRHIPKDVPLYKQSNICFKDKGRRFGKQAHKTI